VSSKRSLLTCRVPIQCSLSLVVSLSVSPYPFPIITCSAYQSFQICQSLHTHDTFGHAFLTHLTTSTCFLLRVCRFRQSELIAVALAERVLHLALIKCFARDNAVDFCKERLMLASHPTTPLHLLNLPVKIFWNANSTLLASNADVSIKLRLFSLANALASSVGTALKCFKSLLFPTSIITILLSA
jgi:hypothetical protein